MNLDLDDVKATVIEAESMEFAVVEMLDVLSDVVGDYRQGKIDMKGVGYEAERLFDSMNWLSIMTRDNLQQVDDQIGQILDADTHRSR
ncbi:hypothetical protein EFE25_04990 [Levilactobacillus brevis]|uniref:hypothetical protein n=1 Tax=Levilactobacillus TaxID=2767886 RepID=UPI0008481716|nr:MULTISPECIES: hypothetical protein [Levilactobacillus]MCS8597088.1 hypothetical protein [Levilactobacillus brevis]NRD28654.1 hypothetical protein [Levilactobacillus brevis]ODP93878.1 hypothetical protein BGC39_05605 [Levilactobacillus brevis]